MPTVSNSVVSAVLLEDVSKTFPPRRSFLSWFNRAWFNRAWFSRAAGAPATLALDHVSFEMPNGEPPAGSVMVLLGPNGSGKTTTLKLISTTLLPDAGRVLIAGYDTRTQAREVRRRVGFAVATERSFFPRLTARENLDFFAALDDVPRRQRPARISEVLEAIGLQDAASKMVMEFSSGMYQRLGVARALMKRPPVLLLDEPTRSLDPGSADKFWDLLRQLASRGTSIILTTHNFQEAAAAGDWVAVLHRGKMSPQRRIAEGAAGVRRLYFEITGHGNGKINADEMELPVAGGAVKCGD